jgi:hypothetical protein
VSDCSCDNCLAADREIVGRGENAGPSRASQVRDAALKWIRAVPLDVIFCQQHVTRDLDRHEIPLYIVKSQKSISQ